METAANPIDRTQFTGVLDLLPNIIPNDILALLLTRDSPSLILLTYAAIFSQLGISIQALAVRI